MTQKQFGYIQKHNKLCIKNINPNPSLAMRRFGFILFGAGNRGRTCMVSRQILSLVRLPIPPYPQTKRLYHLICRIVNRFRA